MFKELILVRDKTNIHKTSRGRLNETDGEDGVSAWMEKLELALERT